MAAGSERTVPALWAGPGDAVTPSEEATDTPPRRRLGLAGQVGGRHGCHGDNTCLRTHCRGVDSALLRPLRHWKNPAEFRSITAGTWSSPSNSPPKTIFCAFSAKQRRKKLAQNGYKHSLSRVHSVACCVLLRPSSAAAAATELLSSSSLLDSSRCCQLLAAPRGGTRHSG